MVELKASDIDKIETMLSEFPEEITKVSVRAINRATTTGSNMAAKEGVKHYFLKQKEIKSAISIRKANYRELNSEVTAYGNPRRLIKYKVNNKIPNTKIPVKVAVKRGQPMKYMGEKTFVAKMDNGSIGIFKRRGKNPYPIDQLYGPSISSMYRNDSLTKTIYENAQEMLEKRLDHEIDRVLRK